VNKHSIITLVAAALTLCVGCHSDESQDVAAAAPAQEAASVPAASAPAAPARAEVPAATGSITGTVVETMDSGGYTYMLVDTGTEQVWAAGPVADVTVGAEVSFDGSMTMADYTSPTLERTFDTIFFTGAFEFEGTAPAGHGGAAQVAGAAEVVSTELLEPAQGGVAVADVFAKSADLVGTEIAVRGKVVKYSAGIMGKNWLHIQDGTGAEGTSDLTITTDATAAVGDIVVVRGVLAADRDFGYGYLYDLIIEDAQITVE